MNLLRLTFGSAMCRGHGLKVEWRVHRIVRRNDEVFHMGDREAESGQRVTALELFFDLVVVFAITQVTTFLSHNATWEPLQGVL